MYASPPGGPSDPMMSMRARLRPMGVGDILDETFRLYRENFTLFISTCAVIEVPIQIISIIFGLTVFAVSMNFSSDVSSGSFGDAGGAIASIIGGGLLLFIIVVVGYTVLSAALAIVIAQRYLGRTATVGSAYSAAFGRVGALILAAIWNGLRIAALFVAVVIVGVILSGVSHGLGAFVLIVGSIAAIVYAIYLGISWSLYPQAIVLEGTGADAASKRSRGLVAGFWWKALGLYIVAGLLVLILGAIIPSIINGILNVVFSSGAGRVIVDGIVSLIVGILLRPIQIAAATLLFYDLKIRKEAFDLEAMAQQQAGFATPQTPY